MGLIHVQQQALPVRVLAKKSLITSRGSDKGVVYAGLYYVSRWDWVVVEDNRWLLFQFEAAPGTVEQLEKYYAAESIASARSLVTTNRINRDSAVVREVKALYKDRCQICSTQLKTAIGTYSEGAHIRPLGRPHDGLDELGNILCLCPNCHKQFDGHALVINSTDFEVAELGVPRGKLTVNKRHKIDALNLEYHVRTSLGH